MAGEGNLRMQVAQTARKLEAEGLMDPSRKKGLPALPRRIAVVTSPRGKAVHDVLRTLRRRYPMGEVMLYGVPVEGALAPQYLSEALQAAYTADPAPEVILLVRGGGSYENLMPFNDEGLARVVAASPVPVITGIGHEPDNSICDMVADRRCSTPTAAAEAVAPSTEELQVKVNNATRALGSALVSCVERAQAELERMSAHPLWRDDKYLTGPYYQALDLADERLRRAIPDAMEADKHNLALMFERMRSIGAGLGVQQSHELDRATQRLAAVGPNIVSVPGRQVALAAAKLDALSPLKTLSRGYSITFGPDGHSVVDSVDKVAAGQGISVQVQDGAVHATVTAVERQE